jgi:hypothetical protein
MSNNVTVTLVTNAANFSQGMKNAQAQLDTFAGKARSAGHSTVSSMQAASASIRLFEGGMTNNIRAVERFISSIPGVSKALQVAFPVVGGLAFAGLIAKLAAAVYKFIQTAKQMPRQIEDAWRGLTDAGQLANDELTKTNDSLRNQIDKLEGKHQNNLAIAIDDARIASDKLADSLQQDYEKVQQLLKANGVGILQGMVTDQARTAPVGGMITYWNQRMADQGHDYNQAVHAYGADSDQAKAAKAALDQIARQYDKNLSDEIEKRSNISKQTGVMGLIHNVGGPVNETANLNDLHAAQTALQQRQDQENLESDNAKLQAQKDKLDAAKAYTDEQKQLASQRVQAMEEELSQRKNVEQMDATDEYAFWEQKLSTLKTSDLAYRAIIEKSGAAYQGAIKEHTDLMKEWADKGMIRPDDLSNVGGGSVASPTSTYQYATDLSKDSDYTKGISEQSKSTAEFLKNLNAGTAIQQANANAIAEASLKMAVAQGAMSKLDAAQVQAQIHTDEYTQALTKLQDALAAVNASTSLTPTEKNAQSTGLQDQISQLNGARAVQIAEDNSAIDMDTVGGSIHEALSRYVQEATDTGAQISAILTNAFNSVNSSLASSLMAKEPSGSEYRKNILNGLSGSARGIGSQLLDSSFKNVEGSALKAFGFGGKAKADGSKANPFYTRSADGSGGIGRASCRERV